MTSSGTDAPAGGPPTLAGLLRVLRVRALLSQEELAFRSGVSVRTIRDLETGRIRLPRRGTLRLLADALDLGERERVALVATVRDEPPRVSPPPAPAQLPAGPAGFTGRSESLRALDALLPDGSGTAPTSVVISGLAGMAGVGKTALALHWAHRVAERFPDGQLYVDLHGATAGLPALQPLEVLGSFLRALGADADQVPSQIDEATARFRSMTAGMRLLVVLDNARDAAQVTPLLPGGAGCAALVTSRRMLGALDCTHLHLDVFPCQDAVTLLGRVAGGERINAEPDAAAEVARFCGWLPLALRITGARLAARPAWPVAAMADRLADEQRRLDELELEEVGVRASFAVSWQELAGGADPLDRAAATAFGLLGVPDGPDIATPAAARLLDMPERRTERVLEQLVDAQLLETPAPGRYRMHDLLRVYARELADEMHPESDRAALLARVLRFYVATTWSTLALLRPGDLRLRTVDAHWSKGGLEFSDAAEALAWLEAERANLLAAVQQAAAADLGVPALQLGSALIGWFGVRGYWQDCVQVNKIALRIACEAGDQAGRARVHTDLGIACHYLGSYAEAAAHLQQSLALHGELGDRRGEGAGLANLGTVYERLGRFEEALACQEQSLAIDRELGDRRGESISLSNLGNIYEELGRFEEGLASQERSLAIARELGDRHHEGITLGNLGNICKRLGWFEEALGYQEQSLAIHRELGDRNGQAETLRDLGALHHRQGQHQQALPYLEESLAISQELVGPRSEAETLRELGSTLHGLGRHDQAGARLRQALAIFERLGATTAADEVRALLAAQLAGSPH